MYPSNLSAIGIHMEKFYLDKIGKYVGANEIYETKNWNDITQIERVVVYHQFGGATQPARCPLHVGCFLDPRWVSWVG